MEPDDDQHSNIEESKEDGHDTSHHNEVDGEGQVPPQIGASAIVENNINSVNPGVPTSVQLSHEQHVLQNAGAQQIQS